MKKSTLVLIAVLLLMGCAGLKNNTTNAHNPLNTILKDASLQTVLSKNKGYEVQIIYTQINRDEQQIPHFTTWHYNVDSTAYFYPASTVKMPLAALALEKINNLKSSGYPRINSATAYALDSVRPFQQPYATEPTALTGKPSIGHDVRAIFAVSDNAAYNHLFDFLGRAYINETLYDKGYQHTIITHRFYAPQRDQSLAQPFRFLDKNGRVILQEKEKIDLNIYKNESKNRLKGHAYKNNQDSLIRAPFDFSAKNQFALTDMERMLRALLFPKAMPEQSRFGISDQDYGMLHRAMGLFPREFEDPQYSEKEHWDSYVKFFVLGDTKTRQTGQVRLFNKVGEAYGTLTDVAYIIDEEKGVEFVLAATILCNSDGVFNDDQYDYDSIGFPFLAQLGKKVMEYEQKRVKKVQPDLKYWNNVLK